MNNISFIVPQNKHKLLIEKNIITLTKKSQPLIVTKILKIIEIHTKMS